MPAKAVATRDDSFEDLLSNLYETIEGCLSVDVQDPPNSAEPSQS